MNTFHPVQARKLRKATPTSEQLDARVLPATMHPAVTAAAAVSDTVRGVLRLEIRLEKLSVRREIAVERLEARAARLEARHPQAVAPNHGLPAVSQIQSTFSAPGPAAPVASPVSGTPVASPVTGGPVPRTLPTGTATGPSNPTTPVGTTEPLPANVDTALDTIYEEYQNGTLPTTPSGPGQVEVEGSDVGVMIHVLNPGDFATVVADAQALGLQVTVSSPSTDNVAGLLPIAELPSVAELPQSPIIVPIYVPVLM